MKKAPEELGLVIHDRFAVRDLVFRIATASRIKCGMAVPLQYRVSKRFGYNILIMTRINMLH